MGESLQSFQELKEKGEMTPIPGFSPEMYLCHCLTGRVYSLVSKKWLLEDAKGTGDDSRYLMTTLKGLDGSVHHVYLHEIVMSSYMGMKKSDWRSMGLEVDHINNLDTKNCAISNLRLASSEANKKNSRDRFWNKTRLSPEVAEQLREEFNVYTGSKIEWYKIKANELGVSARSIQNVILGYTYNPRYFYSDKNGIIHTTEQLYCIAE